MNKDQLYQEKIAEIESGRPVSDVLNEIPEQMADLKELILLSNQIRQETHPVFSTVAKNKQFQKVRLSMNKKSTFQTPSWQWGLLATVVALLMVVIVAGAAVMLLATQPVSAASLQNIQGVVAVKTVNGDWAIGMNNMRVKEGVTLRTYADSTADLRLPDGSVINMEPDTLISVDKFSWNRNGTLEFLVSAQSGGITNTVVPLKGSDSYYHVRTPGGLVTVHGTEFEVYALDNRQSIVNVVHGDVQVENQSGSVDLSTGQMTLASTTNSPSEPVFSFNYNGTVTSAAGDTISLDGSAINLTGETKIVNQPVLNATVHILGHFDANGNQVADIVVPGNGKNVRKSFTGTVGAINGDTWTIGQSTVVVGSGTKVNGSPDVNSVVKVWFHVGTDGTWQADKVVNTSDEAVVAAADAGETPTVEDTPTVPEGSTTTTPGDNPNGTPTIPVETATQAPRTNGVCAIDASQQPNALTLAQRYGTTYEVIMGWFCRNNGFGEIDLAYQLSAQFGKPVDEIFALRETGLGWGQIRQQLEGGKPTKQPKVENTRKPH